MNIDLPPLVWRTGDDRQALVEHIRMVAKAVGHIIGNIKIGRVTFGNGNTSTVLPVKGMTALFGHISLTPTNAAAQAIVWRATYAANQVTFTHTAPVGDATFSYLAAMT